MRLLYLDLSSKTGFAVGALTDTRFTSGVLKLPKVTGRNFGPFFSAFQKWLGAAIDELNPTEIMYEVPILPAGRSHTDIVYRLNGLACLTETCAWNCEILCRDAANWDVMHAFTPEIKNPFMKSDLRKAAVLRECRRRGFKPEDDNEADALAGLAYGLSLYQPGFVLKQEGDNASGRVAGGSELAGV